MKVTAKLLTNWTVVLNAARETASREAAPDGYEPSSAWKKKILLARHSPIRALQFEVKMEGIPYWVSVHIVRHKFGVEHFVSTQRDDRNPNRAAKREDLPQGSPVNHKMILNAEALINMSKKRLCMKASPETRNVWNAVRQAILDIGQAEMAWAMRPECDWCGGCPEMQPCGKMPPKTFPS